MTPLRDLPPNEATLKSETLQTLKTLKGDLTATREGTADSYKNLYSKREPIGKGTR